MEKETAGEKANIGPPSKAVKRVPSSSNSTIAAFSAGPEGMGLRLRTRELGKRET